MPDVIHNAKSNNVTLLAMKVTASVLSDHAKNSRDSRCWAQPGSGG